MQNTQSFIAHLRSPVIASISLIIGFYLSSVVDSSTTRVLLPEVEESRFSPREPSSSYGEKIEPEVVVGSIDTVEDLLAILPTMSFMDLDFSRSPFSLKHEVMQILGQMSTQTVVAFAEDLAGRVPGPDDMRVSILSELIAWRLADDPDITPSICGNWTDSPVKLATVCKLAQSMNISNSEDILEVVSLFNSGTGFHRPLVLKLARILAEKMPLEHADEILTGAWRAIPGDESLPPALIEQQEEVIRMVIYNHHKDKNSLESVDELMQSPLSVERQRILMLPLCVSLLEQDPDSAMHLLVNDRLDPTLRKLLLSNLTRDGLIQNPNGVIANISALPANLQREALEQSVSTLTDQDPAAALRLIAAMGEVESPNVEDMGKIFDNMTANQEDVAELLLSQPELRDKTAKFLARWAETNPVEAADFMKSHGAQIVAREDSAALQAIRALAAVEPDLSLKLADGLSKELRDREIAEVIGIIAENDPRKAASQIEEQVGQARASAITNVANHWIQQAPDQAIEWVAGLPEEDQLDAIRGVVDGAWNAPDAATELLLSHIARGNDVDTSIIQSLIPKVVAKNPESAASLVEQLTADAQQSAIGSLVESWASFDPSMASKWLAEVPQTKARDIGISQLVSSIPDDPASALEWAGFIRDDQLRSESFGQVVDEWRLVDPGYLRGLIDDSSLDDSLKSEAIEKLQDRMLR